MYFYRHQDSIKTSLVSTFNLDMREVVTILTVKKGYMRRTEFFIF